MVFGRDFTSKSIISRLLLMKPNRRVGENVLHADSKAKRLITKIVLGTVDFIANFGSGRLKICNEF